MTVLEKKGYLNNIQAYKQYMLATNSADAASSIHEDGEAEVLGCRVPPYVILDQFAFHVPHRMSFLIKAYRSPHHLSLQISNCSSRLRCAREGSKGSSLYDVNGVLGSTCAHGFALPNLFCNMRRPENFTFYLVGVFSSAQANIKYTCNFFLPSFLSGFAQAHSEGLP